MNLPGENAFGADRGEALGTDRWLDANASRGALDVNASNIANASRGALDAYTNPQVREPHIDLVRKTQEINY